MCSSTSARPARVWPPDLAAEAATSAGARGVLVNLGGDIAVAGQVPDGGWPVFVTDDSTTPPQAGTEAAGQTVSLRDGALATSGISRRRWRRGGSDVHHIVDPSTGMSASTPWRTISVAAPTCFLANAAATAGIVRGTTAVDWLTGTGLSARLVSTASEVVRTGSWPA